MKLKQRQLFPKCLPLLTLLLAFCACQLGTDRVKSPTAAENQEKLVKQENLVKAEKEINLAPSPLKSNDKPGDSLKMSKFTRPSDEELKKKLTKEQYAVTCNEDTEPPFKNAYWDNKAEGIYVDLISGEALFSSLDKYDSGTGWPSFTKPIEDAQVDYKADRSSFSTRTEVHSKNGHAHLGHVFEDGPGPNGLRYCINSASLKFVPLKDMEKLGYGRYLFLFENKKAPLQERIVLAGGCFWGVEDLLRKVPGVISTEVGYSGGEKSKAHYEDVKTGRTQHAEAVKIVFDPQQINLETLLKDHFFKLHDPTTLNKQGNDVGSQYRSAIFYQNENQKSTAQKAIESVQKDFWKKPVVTQVLPLEAFYPAEAYHQKYLIKNPGGYTCHFYRN